MPAPYSYLPANLPMPDITPAFAGITQGVGMVLQAAQAEREKQRQFEQQRQMQIELGKDMQAYQANPNADTYGLLLAKYPALRQQLESMYKAKTEEQRAGELEVYGPLLSSLQYNDQETALKILDDRRTALVNSGKSDQLPVIDHLIGQVKTNPKAAIGSIIPKVASLTGVQDLPQMMKYLGERAPKEKEAEELAEQARITRENLASKLNADEKFTKAKTTEALALARKYNLEADQIGKILETSNEALNAPFDQSKATSQWQQDVGKLYSESVSAGSAAAAYENLANEFASAKYEGYGVASRFAASVRATFGAETKVDEILKQWQALRGSIALKRAAEAKPITNQELKTFLNGLPSEYGNKQLVISFMRAAAKAAKIEEATKNLQLAYRSFNGSEATAAGSTVLNVNGIAIPVRKGDSLSEIRDQFVEELVEREFPETKESATRAEQTIPSAPLGPEEFGAGGRR